ncbi:hypothetical protein HJC23_008802 [Cyclotella cryptica]|uniref:Uncharacterized protein n=1 Tax=Cyclotella cryptica TaxID=29204 RepID=A0ABD3PTI1_9STRA|eukprot:CCRYP_012209-RA/>CCRYP_012209-RA protein AED:0.01 eAED:0.01 QI:203/1/1/1/1/1/2/86/1189
MNNETIKNAGRTTDRCCADQELPSSVRSKRASENGTNTNDQFETAAEADITSQTAAAAAETMDETSSSTSEEVMSGAQSDQTANISSSGGYSGDYESISDSSSGASKKRKTRDDTANATVGEGGRRRRVNDEEKEEKTEHEREDGGIAPLSRPSSLAHMNAAESEDGAMSVDYGRHHHHHHHQMEVDGKHSTTGNHNNSHHHHHYHHHTNRPNKATSRQVNRQIDQIMNLYNVSLQAQANSQAAMRCDAAHGSVEADHNAAAPAGDANPNEIRTQSSRVHYPYQVESKGSLPGDRSQSPHLASNGLLSPRNNVHSNEFRGSVQLGGVRIMDPSDPRIDISKLYQAQNRSKEGSSRANSSQKDNDNNNDPQSASNHNVEDCYTNLMEACRPFFQDTQTIMASKKIPLFRTSNANQSQVASDEAHSSSGFTSFFTTTKSESNTNGCGSGGSSQSEFSHQNKKRKVEQKEEEENSKDGASRSQGDDSTEPNKPSEHMAHHEHQEHQGATLAPTRSYSCSHLEAYQSDSSSMVVLARVKRKHKDQRRHAVNASPISVNTAKAVCAVSSPTSVPAATSAPTAATSQEERRGKGAEELVSKRVRIETVALDAAKYRSSKTLQPSTHKQPESSSLASSLSTSVDSSGSDGGGGAQAKRNDGVHATASTAGISGEDRSKTDSQSGSAENSNNQAARTITDTSGTTTANNSSGSGTGSGNDNDATNKSESGSQMEGNSNSDDKACAYYKKDSVASDTNTVTSVAAVNGDVKKRADSLQESDKPLIHHHNHSAKKSAAVDVSGVHKDLETILEDPQQPNSNSNHITKEEKLIEKKRKRMSARKEYEEEWQRQMRDSSESSSRNETCTLEPGKPVTLEDVLSFTKTARLLVQALPPFLAVHANAAFTQLTGINSHTVIGQPVASIIAIAEGLPPNKESDSSGSDMTNNKDAMSSLSGSLEGNDGQNDVNMASANDPSRQAQQDPPNDGNIVVNAQEPSISAGFRIDRLIVARGYGHIHNVEVIFAPPQVSAHAIEGSEVKINDGNANVKRKKKDDKIFCRMSVSPVVTSIESWDSGRIEGHADSKVHSHSSSSGGKKRKHGHVANELMIVKHYLIQLESIDGPHLLDKRSSFSSSTDTTGEAQLLGITRSELVARRCRLERGQRDATEVAARPSSDGGNLPETDSQDENTSVVEPVATCG